MVYNGDAPLDRFMTLRDTCCRICESIGALQSTAHRHMETTHQLGANLDYVRLELNDIEDGLEEMRIRMQDGVALVCVCVRAVKSCVLPCWVCMQLSASKALW